MKASHTLLSLEAANVPSGEEEDELVIYGVIGNHLGLQRSTHVEYQTQLEAQYKNGVPSRVRKTVNTHGTKYVHTFKLRNNKPGGMKSCREHNIEANEDFFEGFHSVANHKLVKTRFTFDNQSVKVIYNTQDGSETITIPGMKFEVDQFIKADGNTSEYFKLDIELQVLYTYLKQKYPDRGVGKILVNIKNLPFVPRDCFLDTAATPEQKELIARIWAEEFRQPIITE